MAKVAIFLALLVLGVSTRLDIGMPNWALLGAIAIWGGVLFKDSLLKWALPLSILLVTDLAFGFYPGQVWVYLGYLPYVVAGSLLIRPLGGWGLLAPLLGSVGFFIVSNFGVWAGGLLYPVTFEGLVLCYLKALPFFRATLISDFLGFWGLAGVFYLAKPLALKAFVRASWRQ